MPIQDSDRDSLHTLPLSMIPLETPGLKRARMIKNARYQSVVELFAGDGTGSGQINADDLHKVFREVTSQDIGILNKLIELPSYDVYSLRIMLRDQNIVVNENDDLKLSETKKQELSDYMKKFTRPLIFKVYGDDDSIQNYSDVIALFRQADVEKAREKLKIMADKLNIKLTRIYEFLQDYGDIYLSVSYYQQCLDQVRPLIGDFLSALHRLRANQQLQQDRELMQTCARIQSTVEKVTAMIDGRFEVFDRGTRDMWEHISAERFRKVEALIESNHALVGAMLCALTVCITSWSQRFPDADAGGPQRRAEYIRTTMRQGVDNIRAIKIPTPGTAQVH